MNRWMAADVLISVLCHAAAESWLIFAQLLDDAKNPLEGTLD